MVNIYRQYKSALNKWIKRLFYFAIVAIISFSFLFHNDGFYTFFKDQINNRLKSYLNINILGFAHSFAHILDVKGVVLSALNPVKESDIVELEISKKTLKKLESLAVFKEKGKQWLPVKIKINDSFHKAKLRFHGTSSVHYSNGKYSYRIKMSQNSALFNKMRVFNLVKGEDSNPTVLAANQLANNYNLISPYGKMVNLHINEEPKGHYYLVEHLSKDYLQRKHGITDYSILSNVSDWSRKENNLYGSNHISDLDLYFGHIESKTFPKHPQAIGIYKNLCIEINNGNTEMVKTFFDIDYMGKYLALLSLFNDVHFITGDNFKLIYDFKKKKFYPLYRQEHGSIPIFKKIYSQEDMFFNSWANYNKLIFHKSLPNYKNSTNTKLLKLLLSDDSVRNRRDFHLMNLVNKKDSIITFLNETHERNSPVMYASDISRRSYYFAKKQQKDVLNLMCSLAKSYLKYGHIYGSYDKNNQTLHFVSDAFSEVQMVHPNSNFKAINVNGIGFDSELNFKYKYSSIPFQHELSVTNLKFINVITGDTISSEHVHLNEISEPNDFKEQIYGDPTSSKQSSL